jgi:hypothetical protein
VIALGHGAAALVSSEPGHWMLEFDLEQGWHVNSDTVSAASLVPLQVSAHPEGSSVIQHIGFPPALPLETDFYDSPLSVFEGRVSVPIEAAGGSLDIRVRLQACSRELCLLPQTLRLVASENVTP